MIYATLLSWPNCYFYADVHKERNKIVLFNRSFEITTRALEMFSFIIINVNESSSEDPTKRRRFHCQHTHYFQYLNPAISPVQCLHCIPSNPFNRNNPRTPVSPISASVDKSLQRSWCSVHIKAVGTFFVQFCEAVQKTRVGFSPTPPQCAVLTFLSGRSGCQALRPTWQRTPSPVHCVEKIAKR